MNDVIDNRCMDLRAGIDRIKERGVEAVQARRQGTDKNDMALDLFPVCGVIQDSGRGNMVKGPSRSPKTDQKGPLLIERDPAIPKNEGLHTPSAPTRSTHCCTLKAFSRAARARLG